MRKYSVGNIVRINIRGANPDINYVIVDYWTEHQVMNERDIYHYWLMQVNGPASLTVSEESLIFIWKELQ